MSLSYAGFFLQQFLDDNGDPLSSGKLYAYYDNTDTPAPTYNQDGTLNEYPVVLDISGRASIKYDDSITYTLIVYDSLSANHKTYTGVTSAGFKTIITYNLYAGNNTRINEEKYIRVVYDYYQLGTLTGNITLIADKICVLPNALGTVSFSLDSSETDSMPIYTAQFIAGSSTNITWPSGISWLGGSAPTITNGKRYELSISNGLAVIGEF